MNVLGDPRLFNLAIMVLYAAAAIRWGIAGKWADCGYWVSAILLTICLTCRR